jgi:hypothetical protein
VYTVTKVGVLTLPSFYEQMKLLAKLFKALIRVKLEIHDVMRELNEAIWEDDIEEMGADNILDLRKETQTTPTKKGSKF